MFENVLISLLRNAILLLSLGALYEIIPLNSKENAPLQNIFIGILLGIIGIVIMSTPWKFGPGITFDTRSILLSIGGLFFAPISTLIAVAMTIAMRFFVIGGEGAITGTMVILTSACFGLAWRRFRPQIHSGTYGWLELYAFGIIVHVNMLLWMLTLPSPSNFEVLRSISVPVLLIYPIVSVLLGLMLSRQRSRKEIHLKIQENEENLRQVVQNMPVMLDAFDKDFNIIVWNKECERVTGYKAEEIVNNPKALELLYPDAEIRKQILQRLSDPAAYQSREITLIAKDGTPRTIAWGTNAREIHIPGWHYWAIGVDVTTRFQALDALKKSEAQFRRIVETAEEGIWMIDAENKTTYVNQKMGDILGYTTEEMLGKNLFSFMDAAAVAEAKMNIERRRQGIREQHDFRFSHKDGLDVWALLSTTPITGPDQQYEGALAMITDITDRKRIEEEIRQYQQRLQKSQEIGVVGSWEYDLATGEIWGSDEGFRIYGLDIPPDNVMPIDLIESFIPEREMVHQAMLDLINEEKPYDLEFEIRPPHGRYTVITSKAELVKDNQGKPIKVAGVIQDVTVRKLAEDKIQQLNAELEQKVVERTAQLQKTNEALEAALKARDTFLANMSHELRTPLTAILGMSEILEEQIRGPLNEKQLHFVKSIYSSGEHLLNLINDVLDLSKIEAQRFTLDIQDVLLDDVCANSLNFINKQAEDKQIQVGFSLNTRHESIQADPRRLKQILINLLSNAVKFTPTGGKVGLLVEDDHQDPEWVQFTVWDTGIGISHKEQQNLFQPFVQVDSRLNRSYEGTGLGLALVARLTNLHHGQVKMESEPDKGTHVTVRLPCRQNETD